MPLPGVRLGSVLTVSFIGIVDLASMGSAHLFVVVTVGGEDIGDDATSDVVDDNGAGRVRDVILGLNHEGQGKG